MQERGWRVVGASVQGTSHLKRDVPCQDAHAYRCLAGGVALLAVADGAGSAERSHQGAQWAVDRAIAGLEAALEQALPQDETAWESLLVDVFRQARDAILQHATAGELPPRIFATTLTCAVLADGWLVTGQVGDGVVVAQTEDGELFPAVQPQRGEYANETYFLTLEDALQRVVVQTFARPIAALALMSDGLTRLAMNVVEYTPHRPFFEPLLTFAARMDQEPEARAQLEALLASERVCARTDDDKTLVLIARPSLEPALAVDGQAQQPEDG
jgi:hypothetical protein